MSTLNRMAMGGKGSQLDRSLVTRQVFCRARRLIPDSSSKLHQQDCALTLTTRQDRRKSEMSKHKT